MTKAILLTGAPGSGKTTLIRQIVSRLSRPAGGFYTQEIRTGGVRQGFSIITLDDRTGLLAHVDIDSPLRIGKYRVDPSAGSGQALTALESLGVAAIRDAIARQAVVVIDEIGPMELLSPAFRQAVRDALDSRSPVLGTVVKRPTPFTNEIRARPRACPFGELRASSERSRRVTVLELRPANRDRVREQILTLLSNAGQ